MQEILQRDIAEGHCRGSGSVLTVEDDECILFAETAVYRVLYLQRALHRIGVI